MTEKTGKGRQAKAARGSAEPGVLGSLPATRPARLGRRRQGDEPAAPAATAERPPPAAAKPARKPAARKPAAAKPAAAKPAAAKPAAAKPATAREKLAAAKPNRPEAVSAGSPNLRATPPSQGHAVPPPSAGDRRQGPPTGIELVTTAVQAAGEVAQIGATVGKQIVKRALDRIPRP
jgi:hypothetical protein